MLAVQARNQGRIQDCEKARVIHLLADLASIRVGDSAHSNLENMNSYGDLFIILYAVTAFNIELSASDPCAWPIAVYISVPFRELRTCPLQG